MSYSTPAQVRLALDPNAGDGTAPGDQSTAASLPNVQLIDAIAQADADVDMFLSSRYSVPVQPDSVTGQLNSTVSNLSRDIAAYYATLTWRKGRDLTDQDPVIRRYNAAMNRLAAISRGQANLPIPDGSDSSAGGQASAAINPYAGNLFGQDDVDLRQPLLGWPAVRDNWGLL